MGCEPEQPTVTEIYSVVVPVYNAETTIESCLASVIAQTLTPLEVLIIDDGSSDGTEAVARRCETLFAATGIGFNYVRLPRNAGPSTARNRGIQKAQGSFIAFLDADDTWASNKLAIVDQFASGSGAGLVCHDYSEELGLCANIDAVCYNVQTLSLRGMLLRNPAQTSCVVVRNVPALAFDEAMRHCEDYDLWIRIAENAPVLRIVGEPLARLGRPQLSAGGLSSNTLRMRAGEVRVYVNFCRRKWLYRAWLLPGLIALSLLKHVYSWLRRQTQRRY
jgi:glycosyltransferase involved in cell wall biosynthesis